MRRTVLVVVAALAVAGGAALLVRGDDVAARTIADRTQEIAAGLRCPVCQNLSVADSPSGLAGEMRAEIAARARAGQTDEEIRAFFVDRYGEWVLLAPTRRGLNLLPWALPVAALALGLGVWFALVRHRPPNENVSVSKADRDRIERELGSFEEGT